MHERISDKAFWTYSIYNKHDRCYGSNIAVYYMHFNDNNRLLAGKEVSLGGCKISMLNCLLCKALTILNFSSFP